MVNLNYDSGQIISSNVHEIGILAIGSPLENHGASLPIDTDSKIASYLALESSLETGAQFLGIIYVGSEFDYVKHGIHVSLETLIESHLKPILTLAKENLKIKKVVLVNGHGGNLPLTKCINKIEIDLGLEIIINNKIIEEEGPHAGSGEISIGAILGITDATRIKEHCDISKYPEVGMVGLTEAREKNSEIDNAAKELEKNGVTLDPIYGQSLIDKSIQSIIHDVKYLLNEEYDF